MTTFLIISGFAVMVFLPCAFALLSSRSPREADAYGDRLIERGVRPRLRASVRAKAAAMAAATQARRTASAYDPTDVGDPRARSIVNRAEMLARVEVTRGDVTRGEWSNVGDPPVPGRVAHRLPEPRVIPETRRERERRAAHEAPAFVEEHRVPEPQFLDSRMPDFRMTDPRMHGSRVNADRWIAPESRLERAELEAVQARAVAIRAHAEALAAMARAAEAKAAFAAVQAAVAEDQAAHAIHDTRRAA